MRLHAIFPVPSGRLLCSLAALWLAGLEHDDVAAEFPRIVARLRQALDSWLANETVETEEIELTPEEIEKMQALGYLGN